MQESLVLSDVSQEDTVREVVRSLSLPKMTGLKVEWAMDYPGQQLAVDLYARSDADLAEVVETVRLALKDRGIESRPSAEIDAEILLLESA